MGSEFNIVHWFVVSAVILPLYFLPTILARNKRQLTAIFVLNLFLGWTGVGWVGALMWALFEPFEPRSTPQLIVQNIPTQPSMQPSTVFCSSCGKQVVLGGKFCCGCGKPLAPQ